MKTSERQILIIGGGPSGMAAAVQLSRQGHKPIIFEKNRLGGLLRNAGWVENYPGFPEGITGPDLAGLFAKQVQQWRIDVVAKEVTSLDYSDGQFGAVTDKEEYRGAIAVIATGTTANRLDGLTISDGVDNKILHEICTIREKKNQRVAIIGAGDAAFDYALTMAVNNDVTILNRSDQTNCLPLLRERSQDQDSIRYIPNAEVNSIGSSPCGSLLLICQNGEKPLEICADYLVVAIGRKPALDFLSDNVVEQESDLEKKGLLYRIGDVVNGNFRQTGIAVGDGIRAAMKIDRILRRVTP